MGKSNQKDIQAYIINCTKADLICYIHCFTNIQNVYFALIFYTETVLDVWYQCSIKFLLYSGSGSWTEWLYKATFCYNASCIDGMLDSVRENEVKLHLQDTTLKGVEARSRGHVDESFILLSIVRDVRKSAYLAKWWLFFVKSRSLLLADDKWTDVGMGI